MHDHALGNDTVDGLLERLLAGDVAQRRAAAQTLSALGDVGLVPDAAVAIMTTRSIADGEPAVRYALLSALAHLRWVAADHLPALVALLDDDDQIAQARAAWAIGRVGPAARGAVPDLARVAADATRLIDPRWSAAVALQRLGTTGAAAAPVLRAALDDRDADMREASARALGAVAPAREYVPALLGALDDPDHLVRESAAQGLAGYGHAAPQAAADAIADRLDDPWPTVRAAAAAALRAMGRPASVARDAGALGLRDAERPALEAHLAGLRSDAQRTRGISTFEIGKLGPEVGEAVPLLAELMTHDDNLDVRWSAAWGLGRMGGAAEPAIPALLRTIACDPDPDVRAQASWALGCLPADLATAYRVRALERALGDEDSLVREEAAMALGRLGPFARAALPALARRVADEHPLVSERAVGALAAVAVP